MNTQANLNKIEQLDKVHKISEQIKELESMKADLYFVNGFLSRSRARHVTIFLNINLIAAILCFIFSFGSLSFITGLIAVLILFVFMLDKTARIFKRWLNKKALYEVNDLLRRYYKEFNKYSVVE